MYSIASCLSRFATSHPQKEVISYSPVSSRVKASIFTANFKSRPAPLIRGENEHNSTFFFPACVRTNFAFCSDSFFAVRSSSDEQRFDTLISLGRERIRLAFFQDFEKEWGSMGMLLFFVHFSCPHVRVFGAKRPSEQIELDGLDT